MQPSPWQCTVSHACRALGSAQCPTPPTQKRPAERQRPRDTGRTPEGHACHAKQPAERRRPRDTGRTPEGHRGVQPSPWQCTVSHAFNAKATGRAAEAKGHRTDQGTPNDARGTPGCTSDPWAAHIVPRLPRKSQRQSGGDQGTPENERDTGAYIRPRGSVHCPTPATQKRPETKERQRDTGGHRGVHPTPWQCTLSHACELCVVRAFAHAFARSRVRACVRGCVGAWVRGCVGAWVGGCVCVCLCCVVLCLCV